MKIWRHPNSQKPYLRRIEVVKSWSHWIIVFDPTLLIYLEYNTKKYKFQVHDEISIWSNFDKTSENQTYLHKIKPQRPLQWRNQASKVQTSRTSKKLLSILFRQAGEDRSLFTQDQVLKTLVAKKKSSQSHLIQPNRANENRVHPNAISSL